MILERRIAFALKRVNVKIDETTNDALYWVGEDAAKARKVTEQSFHTAARSIGQFRRHRNEKGIPNG